MGMSDVSHINGRNQALRIDDQTTTMYIGTAPTSSATSASIWSIKRLTFSGGLTTIEWADGNDLNDNVWDNRASLSYS